MKVRRSVLAIAAAVVAAALLGAASPGSAALIIGPPGLNEAVQSVTADTACNTATRIMSLGVDLQLTLNYASGAWVAYQFRYYRVDWAGTRISQINTDAWRGPYLIQTFNGYSMVPVTLAGPTGSPGVGHFEADVKIAVWNAKQAQYIYTDWLHLPNYTTSYQGSFGMESALLSYCGTSLLA